MLDPATAFGLACGVIQVVQTSVQAYNICKSFYRNGSLPKDKDTADAVDHLSKTLSIATVASALMIHAANATTALRSQVQPFPGPMTKNDADLIALTKRCEKTGETLLEELKKLKVDKKGSLRKSLAVGARAFKKSSFIKDTAQSLAQYRETLSTTILVRLDLKAIQQSGAFDSLDDTIRNFMVTQGKDHVTFANLIEDCSTATQAHLDESIMRATQEISATVIQRMDQLQLQLDRVRIAENDQERWLNSLFFPEIKVRQEDISGAYRQTFEWIFREDLHSLNMSPKWDSLTDWLKSGHGIYWIHGKPGSGKSTLMNFITQDKRPEVLLRAWANGSTLVLPTFFFWNLGEELQKTSQGLLRSLVHQILDAQPDMISLLPQIMEGKSNPHVASHTWTETRLTQALKSLVRNVANSHRFCFFIDGLDEIEGSQESRENLIDVVTFLGSNPNTKVCISSRPEPIFRRHFSSSPNLELHRLTYGDIKEMVSGKLGPILEKEFPMERYAISRLVHGVVSRSEGVFLWVNLIVQSLTEKAQKGSSLVELTSELDKSPVGIDKLYERMLLNLDPSDRQDALYYFKVIEGLSLNDMSRTPSPYDLHTNPTPGLTLLVLFSAEPDVWQNIEKGDDHLYSASQIEEMCKRLAKRILARTCGLIEIEDAPKDPEEYCKGLVGNSGSPQSIQVACQWRRITFIHKSVQDFLSSKRAEVLLSDFQVTVNAPVVYLRGYIGMFAIWPELRSMDNQFYHQRIMEMKLLCHLLDSTTSTITKETMHELMDTMDRVFCEPIKSKREQNLSQPTAIWQLPTRQHLGFAAYLGLPAYVMDRVAYENPSGEERDFLLVCAVLGSVKSSSIHFSSHLQLIKNLLLSNANPNVKFDFQLDGLQYSYLHPGLTAWTLFLEHGDALCGRNGLSYRGLSWGEGVVKWCDLALCFLDRGADVNCTLWGERESVLPIHLRSLIKQSPLSCLNSFFREKTEFLRLKDVLHSSGASAKFRYRVVSHKLRANKWQHLVVHEEQAKLVADVLDFFEHLHDGNYDGGASHALMEKNKRKLEEMLRELEDSQTEADVIELSNYIPVDGFASDQDDDPNAAGIDSDPFGSDEEHSE